MLHLRFPFSILLLPIFLWSSFQNYHNHEMSFWILCAILHLLVYPSSNGYNSLQDKDTSSIGMLKHPPKVPEFMSQLSLIFDIIAIVLVLYYGNFQSMILISIYILCSRLYSYRKIRLKQYPILGFLVVIICQGALIYLLCQSFYNTLNDNFNHFINAIMASLMVAAIYPLTQIYQHESDKNDGVYTISYVLGCKGTFLFSAVIFILVNIGLIFLLQNVFVFFLWFQFPSIVFFFYWWYEIKKSYDNANFKNTMLMSLLASFGQIGFYIYVLIS